MEKIIIFNNMNDKQLKKALLETIEELEKNKDKIFRKGLKKRIEKIKKTILFNWFLKNLNIEENNKFGKVLNG